MTQLAAPNVRTGLCLRGLDRAAVDVTAGAVAALASRLNGPVLLPDSPGYDRAVQVWNALVTWRPALVVQPTSVADMQTAVRFAREHGIELSAKGGGHHAAGAALSDGGLTLDMRRMRGVRVDPRRRLVDVGPGCLLGELDRATQAHGLATVLGSDAATGVAGLTLGGGFGYLARRFGWAVDNLVEVELVTADGAVVRASEDEHPDLFWAVRGAGANVGVVTRFRFRLHPVGPIITGGQFIWAGSYADDVVDIYRSVTEAAPRELTLALSLRTGRPENDAPEDLYGEPIVTVLACYSGDASAGETLLAPLRSLRPVVDTVRPKPYVEHQHNLGVPQPDGFCQHWQSEFLARLSGDVFQAERLAAATVTSPLSQLVLFQLGGAIADHAPAATAMAHRDANYIALVAACWRPGDPDGDRHRAWAHETWRALLPFSTGGSYVNAQNAGDSPAQMRGAYADTFARLGEVKFAYDPDNFFRCNRNITPVGSTS